MLQTEEHGTGPASSPPHSGAEAGEVPWRALVVEFVDERKGTAWPRSENAPSAHSKLQVDLGDPSFAADLSANLKQAGLVSTLILRGHCPPLALLVDICLVFRSPLRALDVDLFAPPLDDAAASPEARENAKSLSVSGLPVTPLALERLSCKLGGNASSMALVVRLVTTGSCANLRDVAVDIAAQPMERTACLHLRMDAVNGLLCAANTSLLRLQVDGYPAVQSGVSTARTPSISIRLIEQGAKVMKGTRSTSM